MPAFQHILTATDFSDASRGAVDLAASLAREADARLTVVHVVEVPALPDFGFTVDLVTPAADLARSRLDALVGGIRPSHADVTGVVRIGVPFEEILAAVGALGADLVVLGTHGRRGFSHALLGSVAERIVRTCPVPVLTVHPPTASAAGARPRA